MSIGKLIALIFGIIFLLIGIVVIFSGVAIFAISNVYTDSNGYFSTPDYQLTQDNAVAVVFSNINIKFNDSSAYFTPDLANIVQLRVSLTSNDSYFVGVGPTTDVENYLANVPYANITSFTYNAGLEVSTNLIHPTATGDLSNNVPVNQSFWDQTGSQTQSLNWVPKEGSWTFVILKSSGEKGINVGVKASAKVPILTPIATFLVIFGIMFVVLAIVIFIVIARTNKTKIITVAQYTGQPAPARVSEVPYRPYAPQTNLYGTPSAKAGEAQQPVSEQPASQPSVVNEEVYEVANWGPRILAFIIDAIIVSIAVEMAKLPIIFNNPTNSFFIYPNGLSINSIVLFIYFILMESYYGTTVGKEILKLQVITEDGRKPEPREAAISAIGKAFLLPIDLIVGLLMKDTEHEVPLNQRLFQKVSKTLVIVKKQNPPMNTR